MKLKKNLEYYSFAVHLNCVLKLKNYGCEKIKKNKF